MRPILTRPILTLVLAIAASLVHGYPDRPIRIVVPFPPGGAVDTVGRIAAQAIAPALGQPVVIENRAGGGGSIGAEAVAKAAADGYTLLVGTASTHGTNPSVLKNLPYDPIRDFAPIAMIASMPYILIVHPSMPVGSAAELAQLSKKTPGKLNFASYGSGSSNHLATELYNAITGADVVHVPYKGAAPAVADLMSGQVQFMFDVFSTSGAHIRAGKLKLIGVGTRARSPLAPDTPTLHESGAPGYEARTFMALLAPAGTPAAAIERINREVARVLGEKEIRERLTGIGAEVAGGTPADAADAIRREVAKWGALVRERNLRFD